MKSIDYENKMLLLISDDSTHKIFSNKLLEEMRNDTKYWKLNNIFNLFFTVSKSHNEKLKVPFPFMCDFVIMCSMTRFSNSVPSSDFHLNLRR